MFENLKTKKQGIHYSRYIASWRNIGGTHFDHQFKAWLKSEGCDENEVNDIYQLATNGKLELESSAFKFITNTV